MTDPTSRQPNMCDCERGHNGLGVMGRECDCTAGAAQSADSETPALLPCPFCGSNPSLVQALPSGWAVSCAGCGVGSGIRYSLMEDARPLVAEQWNRRADLARPSQAGAIRPLCWIDDTESKCTRAYAPALGGKMMVVELDPGSGEYSAGIDLSGLCFRFVLDTYHDGLGAFTAPAKFPSIEAAKSAAQADYEARVSSSLVETVGVEALVSFARPFADALDIECDFMTPPAPFEDGFDVRRRARAALAAMDTPKGGGQ